jgi:hypothetical protein
MRRTPLRAAPAVDRSREPGYREWHTPAWGRCQACGAPGLLVRHHVILAQHLRALGADPWDMRNALQLGAYCDCHRRHHDAARRLSVRCVPDAAIVLVSECYGAGAGAYLSRYYGP